MDKYGKLFLRAAMMYLGLGVLLGLGMSFSDHGVSEIRFIHIHMMLLGFMAMTIYGVGYHIVPRFNARQVPFPSLVPVQFWLANAGLWGMALMYALGAFYTTGPMRVTFGLFGTLEAVAIFIFIVNMLGALKDDVQQVNARPASATAEAVAEESPEVKLSPSMKIADVLERHPHLEEIMIEEGLGDLANPAVRETSARLVSLEMAAKKAGKELFPMIARLEGKKLVTTASTGNGGQAAAEPAAAVSDIERGELATVGTKIGPLLAVYPETRTVFEKHYGAACFTCPGQETETIEQTAQLHGMPEQKILDEINAIIKTALG